MENNCEYISSKGLLKSCSFYKYNVYTTGHSNDDYINDNIVNYDTLYVANSNIGIFANTLLSNLKAKIILVSGDDDNIIPNSFQDASKQIIESPNIIHWFAQNCIINNPKVSHLPIGLDYHTIHEKQTFWGDKKTPIEQENEIIEILKNAKPFHERTPRIYSTFHFVLNRGDRKEAFENIPKDLIDYEEKEIPRLESHTKQLNYAFVASPFGNGLDCHRTWEALILGCIPIIKSSGLNKLFDDLPVLMVNEWKDINSELLNKTIEEFKNKNFNYEKLTLKYWINKINSYKKYNIVIAGLCKNIEKYLGGSRKNIMKIANQFNDYKIVMVENDSTDNTREFLKKWSEEDSKVKAVFIDNLNQKIKARHRTEAIAYCRNLCQEIISLYNKRDFPYTLMVDMDDCLQSEKFSYKGVLSSIQLLESNRKLAFVGAVIDGPYYDIYALRNEECNYNCWKMVFANLNKMSYVDAVEKFVSSHKKDYSKEENPIPLKSAFGGAGIFRNKYWFESRYRGIENDGTEACEHVPMCLGLVEKGYELVLNPKFILY